MNPYDFYITPEEYEIAAANGIHRNTLNNRIRYLGWDKKRALSEPPQKQVDRSEWRKVAEQNGIRRDTFYARVNDHGWDPEKAATTPPHPNPIELAAAARRKIPKELFELAEKNGIAYGTFKSRVYHSGWDMVRAATEPTWTHKQTCEYGNKRFKEKYGDNPNHYLFPHRQRRASTT